MTLALRQLTALRCGVCGNLLCTPEQDDAVVSVALFGAVPYRVCPACCQEVDAELSADERYRRRVRVAYLRRGMVVRETVTGRTVLAKA